MLSKEAEPFQEAAIDYSVCLYLAKSAKINKSLETA